jgi:hypothetical protein
MGSPQLDVITNEIATANNMLVQLDENIKQLQDQYARMVVVVDAFEKAKGLFESELLPLGES